MVKVLKGGLDSGNPARYKFINAAVSDTRLMGVVAMQLVYHDLITDEDFHQFYYYDYEELGLEHMSLLRSSDFAEVARETLKAFAGLGASLVELSEKEARYMVQWMIADTKAKKQPLPPELSEVKYLYESYSEEIGTAPELLKTEMSDAEMDLLNVKLCVPIKSDYGIVNYYLMRVFGKDDEGARLLVQKGYEEYIKPIAPDTHCTFLRNKITVLDASGLRKLYRCESIVEVEREAAHHLVVSEVEVMKRKVISAHKISDTKISLFEAGMVLNKEEYVTVFKFDDELDPLVLSPVFEKMTPGFTKNEHLLGDMFIEFMPTNEHAEKKVFMLSDDVKNLYYVSRSGEIVLASYGLRDIMEGEDFLQKGQLGKYLKITGRYTFAASMIYDFAESGISSFAAYLELFEE